MIIDCFNLENNLELLDVRLSILNPCVDKFLVFDSDNNDLADKDLEDKIVHVPRGGSDWSWNEIVKPLKKMNLNSSDLIILSEVIEIPNLSEIAELSELAKSSLAVSLVSLTFSNFLNMKSFNVLRDNYQIDKISNNSIACFYSLLGLGDPQVIWDKRDSLPKFDKAKGWRLETDDSANCRKVDIEDYFPEHFVKEKEKHKQLIKA